MTVRCSAYFVVDSLIRRAEGRKPPVSVCCNNSFCLGDFLVTACPPLCLYLFRQKEKDSRFLVSSSLHLSIFYIWSE